MQNGYFKGDGTLPMSTLEFLRDWLLSYILEPDKNTGPLCSKFGRKGN